MQVKIKKALRTKKINFYGYDFDLLKKDKLWNLYFKDTKILKEGKKTKQKALYASISLMLFKGKLEVEKAIKNYNDTIYQNKFINKIKPIFKKIFDFDFPICRYSKFTGRLAIDAVYFDKKINTPQGVSTYDYVNKKYGKLAVKLLKKCI